MTPSLEQELAALLSENSDAAIRREGSAFDDAAGSTSRSLVLFGCGGLGRRTLQGLRRAGIEPVAFADNGQANWGKQIEGLNVLSPAEAARRFGKDAIFIVTIWRAGGPHRFDRTEIQLRELGCARVVPAVVLFWKYPGIFLDYYCLGLPHRILEQRDAVQRAFFMLADDRSRREYVSQIRWRLRADFTGLASPVPEEQYFPDDLFTLTDDETFVDCGAFDGDSIDAFIRRQGAAFRQIVALEPDPMNFARMTRRVAGYSTDVQAKIRLEQLGASDFKGTQRFDGNGSLSSGANPEGSIQIECIPLDALLSDTPPTHLKMDIEGAEPEALRGAARTIRDHAPVLAISAYHKQDHLWRIPEQLQALRGDYRLYVRAHHEECWDTVCYAVPAGRGTPQ